MKGKKILGMIVIVATLTACKSKTLEEAIQTEIPFNIERVVYTEKVEEGEIVLYITEQKKEEEPIEAMAAAFMKKSKKSKWENAGNNHWDYDENPNMTVYMNTFYDYDKKGNLENRIPIIYGKVNNENIQAVQVAEGSGEYEEAKLIYSNGSQYFFKLGDYLAAKGTDGKGEVIEEYEKRNR